MKQEKNIETEKIECEICGKRLNINKDWYRYKTEEKYFCSLKHLNEWENKTWKNMKK